MSLLKQMVYNTASSIWQHGGNIALTGYFAIDSFREARNEGSGILGSMGSAVTSAALPFLMPGGFVGYMGFELATSAPGLAIDGYRALRSYRRKLGQEQRHRAFQNASFQENQQTYTMRQAAMAIAERSRYNRDAAMMGREAKYMLK